MTAAGCEDGSIRLWSLKARKVSLLTGHEAGVNSVAWTPDGRKLASASADKTIKVWKILGKGKPNLLQTIQAHYNAVNSIAWSQDGELLASAAHQTVKVWGSPFPTKEPLRILDAQLDKNGFIKSVSFSFDRKFLAAKCQSSDTLDNNVVHIWDCETWQLVASIPEPTLPKAANGIAFHPRELILATQGENDTAIRIWKLDRRSNTSIALDLQDVPVQLTQGESIQGAVNVRNLSTDVWRKGRCLQVTCQFAPTGTTDTKPTSEIWNWNLTNDVPPGATAKSAANQQIDLAPGQYDARWKVQGIGWDKPTESDWHQMQFTVNPPSTPHQELKSLPPDRVHELQTWLQQLGYKVAVDGIPGSQTQAAFTEFQEKQGIATDGQPNSTTIQLLQQIAITPSEYRPPAKQDKIRVEVYSDTVEIDYDGTKYSGPNLLSRDGFPLKLKKVEERSWKEYGELLFNAIIHNEPNIDGAKGYTLYDGYLSAKKLKNIRFELDLSPNVLSLHRYKWEYLKDPNKEEPLAVYEGSPFYRSYKGPSQRKPFPAKPLKILVAICNPTTLRDPKAPNRLSLRSNQSTEPVEQLVKIDVAQERAIIKDGLKRLQEEGLVEYDFLGGEDGRAPATLDNLKSVLQDGQFHILHIIAHGLFINQKYYLVMEDSNRRHFYVDSEKFGEGFFPDSLRLVVLASCQSAETDEDIAMRGLGARLIQLGIPAVIAMQDLVPVTTAQLLTQYFYHHLARSGRIDMAMAATRFDLYRRPDGKTGDWGIPVLFMGTSDGQLFEIDQDKAQELEPLRPEIKTYEELPGRGDPRPDVFAKNIEELALRHGANPEQTALLRSLAASTQLNSKPLAPQQNRDELKRIITNRLAIDADELEKEVKKASKLSLPTEVYQQVASALNTGKHIILTGPPGTGKTSIAHAICEYVKAKQFSAGTTLTTATADWTTFDTMGGYVPTPQQTLQFRLGIFLQAICDGHWLVIDEINRAEIDKAFGELFTVLSGQRVDLPYTVNDKPVCIRPAANKSEKFDDWIPALKENDNTYSYVIHPNWRIIGTMNVYDKSFLFNMSFAFMRRFAFIDVDVPPDDIYENELLNIEFAGSWFHDWLSEDNKTDLEKLRTAILALLRLEGSTVLTELKLAKNPLMSQRTLGPAIIKDMIHYIRDRYHQSLKNNKNTSLVDIFGEAFMLYAVPQLDGIDQREIHDIHKFTECLFKETSDKKICTNILKRIQVLYPHIKDWSSVE
jgi:MoxR-like ATPase